MMGVHLGVQLGTHYIVGIDGIHCHHFIYGNEMPTELEILLVQEGFNFPLSEN